MRQRHENTHLREPGPWGQGLHARASFLKLVGASIVLSLALLAFDLSVPLGLAGGVPYVLLVALALWSPWHPYIYLMAAVGTALTVVGYFASPEGGVPSVVLTNRGLALLAIWVTALLGARILVSRARLHTILDTAADGIITIDSTGVIESFNKAAEAIFGHSAEEAVGKNVSMLMPSPDRELHDEHIARYLKTGKARIIGVGREVTGRRKDGSTFPMDLLVSELRLAGRRTFTGIVRDITERKRAQEALQEREKQLRLVTDAVPVLISYVDKDQRYRFNNRTYEEWIGLSREEVYGRPVREVLGEAVYERLRPHIENALAGQTVTFEDIVAYEGGGPRHVAAVYVPDFGPDGDVKGFFVVVNDITRLKRAEEVLRKAHDELEQGVAERTAELRKANAALKREIAERKRAEDGHRRSEASLANAQRMARLGNWDWNIVANELYWSDEIYRIFGLRPQEFGATYEAFLETVHPDDRAFVEDAVDKALYEKVPCSIDHRIVLPDGEEKVVHEEAEVTFDEQGKPVHMSGTVQDITQQKRAEEELRKLTRVVEQSPSIIVITDTEGTIEYVNPKFTEVTGYTADEAIGRTPAMLKSGTTPNRTHEDLWETITAGREWQGEILNHRKNGEFYWCRESISPIRDADGEITHFLAIEEDITERRRIEEQLREALKMEVVGQLTGGIAHDFNNLLTVIGGNLELLAERAGKDEGLQRHVDLALKAANRAAELTQKLLAFSRRQALQPQFVDLDKLIQGVTTLLARTLSETIEIETVVPEDLWQTWADPGQVENALLNLAVNARDAMPKGGTLTIETGNVRLDEGKAAKHSDAEPGEYVRLTVMDTGRGMASEVAERAFEPFFTTKEVGKGTGLGLSMVYGFVKQSGGFIDIASEPGQGTRVDVYLPRAEAVKKEPAGAAADPCGPGGGETILVVEDNADVRDLAVTLLASMGYEIVEAENGPDAVSVLEGDTPVDLLFTDLVMPGGLSGQDLAVEAGRLRPGLKVLFTTGYSGKDLAASEETEEQAHLIRKPYRKDELARAVWSALHAPSGEP